MQGRWIGLELDPDLPVAVALHVFIGRTWAELGDAAAAAEQYGQRATRTRWRCTGPRQRLAAPPPPRPRSAEPAASPRGPG